MRCIKPLLNVCASTDRAGAADDNTILAFIDVAEDCLTIFAVCFRCKDDLIFRNALCNQFITDVFVHREVPVIAVDCNVRENDLHAFLFRGIIIILPYAIYTGIDFSGFLLHESFRQFSFLTLTVQRRNRLIAQGMSIELTDAARDLVAKEGTDSIYGARPLRRAIQTLIEDPLAEELLANNWRSGDVILVDAEDGHLTFTHGEGEIPAPSERIHMALPKARSHWTPESRPTTSGDLAGASD